MNYSKFSVVIPTMWKYEPFVNFLKDIVECPSVDEVIIINNAVDLTPAEYDKSLRHHEKIIEISYGENIFVNPAWNIGVQTSRNKKVCIINDDIIFDLRLFHHADRVLNEHTGVLGLCQGSTDWNQPTLIDGSIDIRPWNNEVISAYGCLMFVHKDWWIDIPSDLKVYFGDNWIFDTCLMRGLHPHIITNLLFHTPYAVTSRDLVGEFSDKESAIYLEHKKEFGNQLGTILSIRAYLEHEYNQHCAAQTDINEHLPVLYEYAKKCNQVTEFGVRTGSSTRAFLHAGVKLRSYDLEKNDYVEYLFATGRNAGFDVQYITGEDGNTLTNEIQPTDLLFIDTDHTYVQLSAELMRHAYKANRYIAFHDTISCAAELNHAILEFLAHNPEWRVVVQRNNNNGLTILERI